MVQHNLQHTAISVTDGRISTSPQFAIIDFDPLPILVNNQLKISQGQTVTLTTDNLLATHVGVADPTIDAYHYQHQQWPLYCAGKRLAIRPPLRHEFSTTANHGSVGVILSAGNRCTGLRGIG